MREVKYYKEVSTKRWRMQKDSLVKIINDFLSDKDCVLIEVDYPKLNSDLNARYPCLDTDFTLIRGEEKIVYSMLHAEYDQWENPNDHLLKEVEKLVS